MDREEWEGGHLGNESGGNVEVRRWRDVGQSMMVRGCKSRDEGLGIQKGVLWY